MEVLGTLFGSGTLLLLAWVVLFGFRKRDDGNGKSEWGRRKKNIHVINPEDWFPVKIKVKGSVDTYAALNNVFTDFRLKYRIDGTGKFAICHEGTVSSLKKKIGLGDMETGDPNFDENMLVLAKEPSCLRAFLNGNTRSLILKLDGKAGDFLFTDRELAVSVPHGDAAGTREADTCVSAIKDLIKDLIHEFADNPDIRNRYIDLVRCDDVPGVRLSAMRELSSLPSEEKLVPLFRQCLEDDNFEISFEASRFLGEEGMAYLAGTLAAPRGLKPADRIRIIREIGLKDYRKGIQSLLVIYNSVPPDERIEILKVLEEMGDDSCCEFLLKRLGLDDAGERSQLVDTLATCGNADTVRRLRTMAKVVKRKVIRSVYDDIAVRIVARLEKSGEGGRLSMPETTPLDGALSRDGTAGEGALSEEGDGKI